MREVVRATNELKNVAIDVKLINPTVKAPIDSGTPASEMVTPDDFWWWTQSRIKF